MRLPIQFALTYPERLPSPYCKLDFGNPFELSFQPVPEEKFPGLKLAYDALKKGGVYPAALNAADETAVAAFLNKQIGFDRIPQLIGSALESIENNGDLNGVSEFSLQDILRTDKYIRKFVRDLAAG